MDLLLIDIGGTEIKGALWREGAAGPEKLPSLPTRAEEGAKRIIERIIEHIEGYAFDGIGIATAGQVHTKDGSIRYANPNIPGYTGTPLRRIFEERYGVPVRVENDVNAAALGELHYGIGKRENKRDFLCLAVGTGIGGAIIRDGRIDGGSSGGAGEFGHLVTHADARLTDPRLLDRKCKENEAFPMSGFYESYASTAALVRNAMRYDKSLADGRKVFAAFDDPVVRRIIDRWIGELAMGIISLIHSLSPELIVFAGGIMREPYIPERLQELVDLHVFPSFLPVKLRRAELGGDANLFGAASLFLQT